MANPLHVEGFSAPSGQEWILVNDGDRRGWIPRPAFRGRASEAIDQLARQNIVIIGASRLKALIDRVAEISDFPTHPLIESVGWNGCHFALPDGTVFSPNDRVSGEVIFDRVHNRCAERGTLRNWKRSVAKPLAHQNIATFVLSLAFAAPILRLTNRVGNFGFELVGPGGTGKSTFQQLMSSVLGGAIQGEDGHYWTSFDATPDGLEQSMASHSDLPMILEEANLFIAGESQRVRGERFKALAFRLSGGTDKRRFGHSAAGEYRFVYLTSSNEPLSELIGRNSETARAASDRLITIPLPSDRPHGFFDSIPESLNGGGDFARNLIAAANRNHGRAIRRFLQRLVDARATDEERLKTEIGALIARFYNKANIDLGDGSATRVAEAFGIVYAAGELARQYGALPRQHWCGPAVLACYHLHLANKAHIQSFASLLAGMTKRADVIDLGRRKVADIDRIALASASAFVRKDGGERELWVRPSRINALIPSWERIKNDPEVDALLKREGRHERLKRPVGPGRAAQRVYCFRLPESE